MTITNPLLLQNPIEKIDQLQPSHVEPAIKSIIADNLAALEQLSQQEHLTWQSFMQPLEHLENRLNKAWSPVSHLNSVCNSKSLRQAYDKALALLTDYSTQLGQHQGLFLATKAVYDNAQAEQLNDCQMHILRDSLTAFKLSGMHLKPEQQREFAQIQSRLAELSSKYEQNILDATMSWRKPIKDKAQLAGLPETELAMLAANAKSNELEGYLISLEIPSYLAIMTYADDRALREQVYRAYSTRASEQALTVDPVSEDLNSDPSSAADSNHVNPLDNGPLMVEMLQLKNQKAKLLGFNNFAELSVETKMAESPAQVIEFLQKLNQASRNQAKQEYQSLKGFAFAQDKVELQAWDVAYYSEKLKQQNYQISQAELRPYFPIDNVLKGLFSISQHHFAISFKEIQQPIVWHSDVRHFQILREQTVIAEFYLDLYARPHKRGGAWMNDYQGRFKLDDNSFQIPVAYLTCNFAPPVEGKPALLTHDEVVTLFHEFGHGIHHMLTQVEHLSAAGISNVPWDAVELPSQFMENFCYQPEVIAMLSSHYQTGEPLPQALLDKLIAAKNFQSAMAMVRQLEFALFDMHLHLTEEVDTKLDVNGIQSLLDDIREQVAVAKAPEFNRFQNGFSHIFAGGYSAGYYSYKWAEILSADAFALFEEQGVMNQAAGKQFLENILEKGGSAEPMELFKAFRGREPEVEPLLRHSGIS
jgi:oligopeptidase A